MASNDPIRIGKALIDKYKPKEVLPEYTKVPQASGALEMVIQDVMKFMIYPSYEMATAVAMHCISTFGGGMYHLDRRTCCRKRTILAPTGRGKSIANKYFSELVRVLALKNNMFDPYKFSGASHYAVNNIHLELVEHRCRSYITNEAGILGKSRAGTTHEIRAYFLNVIAGDYNEGFDGRKLSVRNPENKAINDALRTAYSIIPVLLSESVPDQYIDVLNSSDAFRSGDVGREEMFFIDPIKKKTMDERQPINPDVVTMMFSLARHFEESGSTRGDNPSNPESFIAVDYSEIKDDLHNLRIKCVEEENHASYNRNYVEIAVTSRFYEKVLTTILVQSIADAGAKGKHSDIPVPIATKGHFDYAVDYHNALKKSLISQTSGSGLLSDPFNQCISRIIQQGKEFGQRARDSRGAYDVKNKIIRRAWITTVLDPTKFRPIKDLLAMRNNNRTAVFKELIETLEEDCIIIPVGVDDCGMWGGQKIRHWRINV